MKDADGKTMKLGDTVHTVFGDGAILTGTFRPIGKLMGCVASGDRESNCSPCNTFVDRVRAEERAAVEHAAWQRQLNRRKGLA